MFSLRTTLVVCAVTALACGKSDAVLNTSPQKPKTDTTSSCGDSCPVAPPDAPPSVDFTEPKSNALLSGKTLLLRGVAADDQPGLEVELSLDGTTWFPAPLSNGAFAVTVGLPDLDGDFLTLRAQARDSAGHGLQTLIQVKVDNVAPRATIDAVPSASRAAWLAGVTVSGDAADGSTLTQLRVDLGDGRGFHSPTVAGGRWSSVFTADGTEDAVRRTVTVEATDAQGNTTTAQRDFTLDVVLPRITITSPVQGARFNAADLAATGTVAVRFNVVDGDPATVVREVGSTTAITALDVATAPTDDGASYTVMLEAVDSSGNRNTEAVDFEVDRVAPSIRALAPPDGQSTDQGLAVVKFSEPMRTTVAGATSIPATPPGAWNSYRLNYEVPLASPDTSYVLTLGLVTDDFGNPLPPQPTWRVRRGPVLPVDGAVIATGVTEFAAAADEDGALMLVTSAGPSARTHRVDAQTGAFVSGTPEPIVPGTTLNAWAHRTLVPGQPPSRAAGATIITAAGYVRLDWWKDGTAMPSVLHAPALIPTPALEGEGQNLGPVGFVRFGSYERPGRQEVHMSVRTDRLAAVEGRWEAVEVNPAGFTRQSFGCSRPYPNGPLQCALTPNGGLNLFGSTPKYSHAITRHCSFHVYNDTTGSRALYTEPFPDSCRLGSCPVPSISVEAPSSELDVATSSATVAVAARRTPQGISVFELVPDPGCNPVLGQSAQLNANNVAAFKPVRMRNRPGLVWLDTSGTLRLFNP